MTLLKPVVLLGSSRKNGETSRAIDIAFGNAVDRVDLLDYQIGPYDYGYANKDDDFLKVIDVLLSRKTIIFATPVYWYAMSAHLKIFMDRLSDLVRVEKKRGRSLAGKNVWLLVTGTDRDLPEGYEVPFAKTCAYLDMRYRGVAYLYAHVDQQLRDESDRQMKEFGASILNTLILEA